MISFTNMKQLQVIRIVIFEIVMLLLKIPSYGMISALIAGIWVGMSGKDDPYTAALLVILVISYLERAITYGLHDLIREIYELTY